MEQTSFETTIRQWQPQPSLFTLQPLSPDSIDSDEVLANSWGLQSYGGAAFGCKMHLPQLSGRVTMLTRPNTGGSVCIRATSDAVFRGRHLKSQTYKHLCQYCPIVINSYTLISLQQMTVPELPGNSRVRDCSPRPAASTGGAHCSIYCSSAPVPLGLSRHWWKSNIIISN